MRHDCQRSTNGREWQICPVCDGRVHMAGCTARRNPKCDCCKRRHKALYEAGETVARNGFAVAEVPVGMLDEFELLDD